MTFSFSTLVYPLLTSQNIKGFSLAFFMILIGADLSKEVEDVGGFFWVENLLKFYATTNLLYIKADIKNGIMSRQWKLNFLHKKNRRHNKYIVSEMFQHGHTHLGRPINFAEIKHISTYYHIVQYLFKSCSKQIKFRVTAVKTQSLFGTRIASLSSEMFKNPLHKKENLGKTSAVSEFGNISAISSAKLVVWWPKVKPLQYLAFSTWKWWFWCQIHHSIYWIFSSFSWNKSW